MLCSFSALLVLVHTVSGHMSPFMPSMYGNPALYPDLNPVNPLGPGWDYDDWWFRGPEVRAAVPEEGAVTNVPAGGETTLEIACGPHYTTMFGSDSNGNVACDDPGPYHADPDALNVERKWLAGCALGIADVMDPNDATPDNFVIFSVQQECVLTRNTTFAIPARMPPCTGEYCICGWVWEPQTGTGNAYHTPFRCRITGSQEDATPIASPQDPAPCEGDPESCTIGAKKMLMVYNTPTNVYVDFGSDDRPRYDDTWGFFDGAQDDIFATAASGTGPTSAILTSTSTDPMSSATSHSSSPVQSSQTLASDSSYASSAASQTSRPPTSTSSTLLSTSISTSAASTPSPSAASTTSTDGSLISISISLNLPLPSLPTLSGLLTTPTATTASSSATRASSTPLTTGTSQEAVTPSRAVRIPLRDREAALSTSQALSTPTRAARIPLRDREAALQSLSSSTSTSPTRTATATASRIQWKLLQPSSTIASTSTSAAAGGTVIRPARLTFAERKAQEPRLRRRAGVPRRLQQGRREL